MTETKSKTQAEPVDLFESFRTGGGGFWNDQDVEITYSKIELIDFTTKEGVDKSGGKGPKSAWVIKGRIVGEEREHKEDYGTGDSTKPSADGESLVLAKDGSPAQFHEKAHAAEFARRLKAAGLDMKTLYQDGKPKVSNLVGTVIRFEGVEKLDKSGKVKTKPWQGKEYTQYKFWPTLVVGQKTPANGKVADTAEVALAAKEAVYAIVSERKSITRPLLAREIMKKLHGKPNAMAILNRAIDDTHLRAAGQPWTFDGTTVSLP